MKVSVIVIGVCLLFGSALAASIECNIDECRKPMKIYEELGCKPIYGSKSCCPKRFECPDDIKVIKDEDKCTYQGVAFKIGEVLPRKFTNESKCLEACICSSRYEEEAVKFVCEASDCGISSFKVPGCINIFGDVNECCSTSIVCDDGEKEKLATCWDESTKYYEGEKFLAQSDPCYECLCHADFDNATIITETSHCRKLNCEIELKYKSEIQRGCLPIFENGKCCPVDWKCPNNSKKVKRSPQDVFVITPSTDSPETETTTIEEDDDDDEESATEAQKIDSTTTEALKDILAEIINAASAAETTEKVEESTTEKVDESITTQKAEEQLSTTEQSSTTGQISTTAADESESTTKEEKIEIEKEPTIITPAETTTEVQTTLSSDDESKSIDESSTTSSSESTTISSIDETTSEDQKDITTTEKQQETTESTETETPPPPPPTAIAMLVTTLKEFLSNIQLDETKVSEDSPPASFVNYTISRSLSIKEEEESKSLTKRSLDLTPQYIKRSNKEKGGGCSFGVRLYKVGEEIKTDNECLECFCYYAPIGHCIRKEKCIA